MNKVASYSIGLLMIFLNVVCLVLESEVYQGIQEPTSRNYYNKPYFITWFSGIGYAFFLIPFFIERMRYQFFTQKRSIKEFILFEEEEKMIIKFSLIAYIPYYLAGYAWMISLPDTSVSANLIIYNSMFVFVFAFSCLVLKERVTALKIASIVICFIGVVITTYSSVNSDDESGVNQTFLGYILLIVSVIITALYDVLYKYFSSKYVNMVNHLRNVKFYSINSLDDENEIADNNFNNEKNDKNDQKVEELVYYNNDNNNNNNDHKKDNNGNNDNNDDNNDGNNGDDKIGKVKEGLEEKSEDRKQDIQSERLSTSLLCTGAIGLFAFTTLWPGIFLLDFLQIEIFEKPSLSVINELLLAVTIDGMQNSFSLAGISFTSPLFMSIGGLISIPLSVIGDMIFHQYLIPWFGFIGVLGIFFGFLVYTYSDYKNPIPL